MSSEEYEVIESVDAGASITRPMEASRIKKGGHLVIRGKPCKVLFFSAVKTGKHGHTKITFTGKDIFTGKKHRAIVQSNHKTPVPFVLNANWEINDIDGKALTLIDDKGNQKSDLNLPTYPDAMSHEIRDAWADGENIVKVTVQSALGIEQVVAWKKIDT
jgi:translation initiation factor 5A